MATVGVNGLIRSTQCTNRHRSDAVAVARTEIGHRRRRWMLSGTPVGRLRGSQLVAGCPLGESSPQRAAMDERVSSRPALGHDVHWGPASRASDVQRRTLQLPAAARTALRGAVSTRTQHHLCRRQCRWTVQDRLFRPLCISPVDNATRIIISHFKTAYTVCLSQHPFPLADKSDMFSLWIHGRRHCSVRRAVTSWLLKCSTLRHSFTSFSVLKTLFLMSFRLISSTRFSQQQTLLSSLAPNTQTDSI